MVSVTSELCLCKSTGASLALNTHLSLKTVLLYMGGAQQENTRSLKEYKCKEKSNSTFKR